MVVLHFSLLVTAVSTADTFAYASHPVWCPLPGPLAHVYGRLFGAWTNMARRPGLSRNNDACAGWGGSSRR